MLKSANSLRGARAWLWVSLMLSACFAARAQSQAAFYQRHPLTVVAFSEAGSTYDTYARPLARHLADHIPGKPVIEGLKAALGRT
jgi:tripartite-type tricarboxylate transporter receptor subunit TctC